MNVRITFIFISVIIINHWIEKKKLSRVDFHAINFVIFWYFRPRSIKMWRMAMKKEHLADWTSHEICPHNRQKSHCLWHDVQVSLKFCSSLQISYKIPISWIRSKTWCSNSCQQPYYWISSGPLSTVCVVAISFYAAFGVITSNNAPQIDCFFYKSRYNDW